MASLLSPKCHGIGVLGLALIIRQVVKWVRLAASETFLRWHNLVNTKT